MASLGEADRQTVQTTWREAVSKSGGASNLGIALFDLFFTQKPEYVKLFPTLKDIPASDLKTHPNLKTQATKVASSLNDVIESLSDADTEERLIKQLGKDHITRNVGEGHFQEMQKTILTLLESSLGEATFTPAVKASWDKALTVVMDSIVQNMK